MADPRESLAERAERELNDVLARFAAGEAEVVRTFFAREHTRDEYADMLRRQMGREIFCVEWLDRANRMGQELERSASWPFVQQLVARTDLECLGVGKLC